MISGTLDIVAIVVGKSGLEAAVLRVTKVKS